MDVAQVPSARVGMELPAVNLKVSARSWRAGVQEPVGMGSEQKEKGRVVGRRQRTGERGTPGDWDGQGRSPRPPTQAVTGPGLPGPALIVSHRSRHLST